MALDFEWTGKHWIARKVRRKLAWHEHRGVAHYDRERMRRPLDPIVQPNSFAGYSAPPTWAELPDSWGEWEQSPAGHFHDGSPWADGATADDLDAPPIAVGEGYTLERCHVETVCGPTLNRRRVSYRWELAFADAMFRFVSRSIAEAALSELLRVRKAKHPRPKFGKHSSENSAIFFTSRKLRNLPADADKMEPPATMPVETAA